MTSRDWALQLDIPEMRSHPIQNPISREREPAKPSDQNSGGLVFIRVIKGLFPVHVEIRP